MTPERGLIQCALFTPMSPGVLIEKTAASFKVLSIPRGQFDLLVFR
jgi:hypothetical protein